MSRRAFLIVDACVLIDLVDADPSVLTLVCQHVGELHVATPVLAEVKQLDASQAESLGLRLLEPTLEMTQEAARSRGPLSFPDRLCFLLAKERQWTCVSNDKRLRRACEDASVSVVWGLELVALLVDERALSVEDAAEIGQRIHVANRLIGDSVLDRFFVRVGHAKYK